MNIKASIVKYLKTTSVVKRLLALDAYLQEAHLQDRLHNIRSHGQHMGPGMNSRKHREAIDRFNHNKFWFMAKRKYEI